MIITFVLLLFPLYFTVFVLTTVYQTLTFSLLSLYAAQINLRLVDA